MKKLLMMGLLIVACGVNFTGYAKPHEELLDKIIAVVNDDVITESEFHHALSIVKIQISQQGIKAPEEPVLKKQVLEQLINKKLQLQIAKQAGVQVTETDLDQAIGNIAQQNNLSVGELYDHLTQEGMTKTAYRTEMRDQMTLQKLQQQEVISRINISKQELETFMRSKAWQSNSDKEYHLEDILIPVSDTPSTQELAAAKKRAQDLIAKIKQGENFNKAAQAESSGEHALQGGDLGWRKLPEIPSAFAEEISHMKAKSIAGPIQTSNGYHIIRLAGVRALDNDKPAMDSKQVENLLLQRKFEEALQNWVSKIRSQAYIVMES